MIITPSPAWAVIRPQASFPISPASSQRMTASMIRLRYGPAGERWVPGEATIFTPLARAASISRVASSTVTVIVFCT